MLDKLQRIAQSIQFFLVPSIGIGVGCLLAATTIIFTSTTHEGDHYLIPALVGLVWALSVYAFIVTFRNIPARKSEGIGFFQKLKRSIVRGWYWVVGVVFIATTFSAIFITYRLISIWIKDFAG